MIQAQIRKSFAAARDSSAFSLDVEFEVQAGITVLFGPSGAGKTLTLECIAGFEAPDEGRILVGGAILFDGAAKVNLPPRARRCGYVFQNYALFPHMTIRENLRFAARGRQLEKHRKVNEMLERFHLSEVAGRKPREVSGGQQQRCSIARALIGAPNVLLLDEPARGLDAPLRTELYSLLDQVRKEFQTPTLVVTHDLEECFELGERMLVFREGRLVQAGTPREVLERPANLAVARLLGRFNLLPAEVLALDPAQNTSRLRFAGNDLAGPYLKGHFRGDKVWLCVRPEELKVCSRDGKPEPNQIPMQLERAGETPGGVRLQFEHGLTVHVERAEYERLRHNREWMIEFRPEVIRVL
ncbi:MAG: ABC transporter ATP-binding protein [Bryobacterales bacterium]|nr:ABC transporter ATP-binding protein [Bryobacterales bacterium]